MLGYRKKNMSSKGKTVFVEYNSFRTHGVAKKNELCAMDSLNCDCTDGRIRTGIGVKRYLDALGDEVRFDFGGYLDSVYAVESISSESETQPTEHFVCVDDCGEVYVYDEDLDEFVSKVAIGVGASAVTATDLSYDTRTMFIGEDTAYYFKNGTWSRAPIKNALAVCLCKNRVFVATKPYTVIYSMTTDPWQFGESIDEDGSICLYSECGSIVGMLTFEEKVFVFLKRGIMTIDTDGAARNFKVEQLAYSGGEIFGKTAGACGNSIIFMATDGIYRLKNGSIERIGDQLEIKPFDLWQVCNHAALGKDFLMRYLDSSGEMKVVLIREDGTGYYISDLDGLSEFNKKPLCRVDGFISILSYDGCLPSGEEYYFTTGELDFGLRGRKHLKKLYFEGDGSFLCRVWQGESYREEELSFVNGRACMCVGECGESFSITLCLYKGAEIRKMRAEIAVAQ